MFFYMEPQKRVKRENHVNYSLQSLFDYLHVNYMLFTYFVNFQLSQCCTCRVKISHGLRILKSLASIFQIRRVCNPC